MSDEMRTYRHEARPTIFWLWNEPKRRLMEHIRERQGKGENITLQTVCGEALDLYAVKHGIQPFGVRSMRRDK